MVSSYCRTAFNSNDLLMQFEALNSLVGWFQGSHGTYTVNHLERPTLSLTAAESI